MQNNSLILNYQNDVRKYALSFLDGDSDNAVFLDNEYSHFPQELLFQLKEVHKRIVNREFIFTKSFNVIIKKTGLDLLELLKIKDELNTTLKEIILEYFKNVNTWILDALMDIKREAKSKNEICKVNWFSKRIKSSSLFFRETGRIEYESRTFVTYINNEIIEFDPTKIFLNIGSDGLIKGQGELMFLEWIETKSLRKLAKEYEMDHNKLHRAVRKSYFELCNTEKIFIDKLPLFINPDGSWITTNNKSLLNIKKIKEMLKENECSNKSHRKREIKTICLFMVKYDEVQKKNVPTNKFIFIFDETKSLEENIKNLENVINKIYPNRTNTVVIGDSANWIRSMAKTLDAEYAIDKFHYVKEIMNSIAKLTITKNQKDNFVREWGYYIYELAKVSKTSKEFIEKILDLLTHITGELMTYEKHKNKFRFVAKHFFEFKSTTENYYISMIEAIQSNTIAEHLRYKRATFGIESVKLITNYMMIKYNVLTLKTLKVTELNKILLNYVSLKMNNCNTITSEVSLEQDNIKNPRGCVTSKKHSNY